MAHLLSRLKVKEIMTKDPVTIEADKTLDDAALLMLKKKVASLPVMDNKHLVGIVTESDIFKALVNLTGAHQGGVKFGFELHDRPGSIKEAADVIRSFGGRIISVLTSYEDAREGFRHVFMRAQNIPRKSLKELKDQLGKKFRILFMKEAEKERR
jgi:acetoin utilization protein AcuB